MMRRRSRSPRPRRRSPGVRHERDRFERTSKSFSMSSLSDCSVGNNHRQHYESRDRTKDRSRRESFERHFSERDRINSENKNSREPIEERMHFEQKLAYQGNNRNSMDQVHDPSSLNFIGSEVPQNESTYVHPKNTNEDRLERLERMVEILVQNKHQVSDSVPIDRKNTNISLESNPKTPQFVTSLWLNRINEECLQRNFDEVTCIHFIKSKMTGFMKAWFKILNPYQYTWPELKMLIMKMFPDTIDFATTLRLLIERVKRSDETITQYYYSKMYLIEACKITGSNAVSCLIDGLPDPQLQKEAKECNFLTPETLYAQFLSKIPNFGLPVNLEPEPEPPLEVIRDTVLVNDRDWYVSHEDLQHHEKVDHSSKRCYTCGKVGHIAEDCRHAPVCYNCRNKGHIAAKCPN